MNLLEGLCIENSEPVATLICNVSDLDPDVKSSLVSSYTTMKATGESTEVEDGRLSVPFTITVDDSLQKGSLIVAQQDGRWVLLDVATSSNEEPITEEEVENLEDSNSTNVEVGDIQEDEVINPDAIETVKPSESFEGL